MSYRAFVLGAALATAVLPAAAQNNVVRIVATVDKFDAQTLVVKTGDGKTETFTVAPDLTVFESKKATVKDVKAGDFVASAAMHGSDGKLHSTELRIFPEAMRGNGEGQRAMNDAQNQMMTNATVTEVVGVGPSGALKVKFPGGDSELVVDPGVPVSRIVPGDKSLVKSGVKVQVTGTKAADGAQTASRLVVQ